MLKPLYSNDKVLWQMSLAEKMAIHYILDRLPKRQCAIEIGTYKGGTLQILSKYFEKVYSCDIRHDWTTNKEQYNNVVWITGDSKDTVPQLINTIDDDVTFILIDGDHSYTGALLDLHNILKYKPKSETIILMHDSWYKGVRKVLDEVDWEAEPTVSFVEKDLTTGDFVGETLIGGIALIKLVPKKTETVVLSTYEYTYGIMSKITY